MLGSRLAGTLAAASAFKVAGEDASLAVSHVGSVQPATVNDRSVVGEGSSDFVPSPSASKLDNDSTPTPQRTSSPKSSPAKLHQASQGRPSSTSWAAPDSSSPAASASESASQSEQPTASPSKTKKTKTETPEPSSTKTGDDGDGDSDDD